MRRQILLRDLNIRLVIIAIAFFIWFHAVTERQYEHTFPVKVIPINIPDDYVITNHHTESVDVLFRGTGKILLQALINRKMEIAADVSGRHGRNLSIGLELRDLNINGSDLDLEPIAFVTADTLNFTLEPLKAREVPVVSKIEIRPVPGYTVVGGIQLSPNKVSITGPKSMVDSTDGIETDYTQLSEINKDISGIIRLTNPDAEKISIDITEVSYTADIQQLGEKDIRDIPVRVLNAPEAVRASVLPSTLSLKIKGGFELLESIHKGDILAYVDYRQYESSGESVLLPLFKTPNEITIFEVFPEKFELRIE